MNGPPLDPRAPSVRGEDMTSNSLTPSARFTEPSFNREHREFLTSAGRASGTATRPDYPNLYVRQALPVDERHRSLRRLRVRQQQPPGLHLRAELRRNRQHQDEGANGQDHLADGRPSRYTAEDDLRQHVHVRIDSAARTDEDRRQNLSYDGNGNQTASTGTFEVGRDSVRSSISLPQAVSGPDSRRLEDSSDS